MWLGEAVEYGFGWVMSGKNGKCWGMFLLSLVEFG